MEKSEVQLFVESNFRNGLREFRSKKLGQDTTSLDDYQKTLIYYYTCEFYEPLNDALRSEKLNDRLSDYCRFLNEALDVLASFKGVVYRGVELSKNQINRYKKALDDKEYIIEPAFTSASTKEDIAQAYSKGKVMFEIRSLRSNSNGKLIDDISYYGCKNSAANEKEVLFKSSTKFKVLSIETKPNGSTLITLNEIE